MRFPLVGNVKISASIENALKEHRLPHAILIDGDSGTGRHTLANYLSFAAVCSNDKIPCLNCDNCRLAQNKNHPDIITVTLEEGKKNISVPQIRQLRSDVFIKSHKANSKVFIIEYADTMNAQSQNTLLKILEEPPMGTFFILIAESHAALLDTIISRCVVLTLNSPDFSTGYDYICENTQFDHEEIENALKAAQNNIGKALLYLQGNSDTKTTLAAKEFLSFMLRGDEWGMLSVLADFEKSRVETDRFFKDLKIAVANEIKRNTKSSKAPALLDFYNTLQQLEEQLVTNINLSLLFTGLTAKAKRCLD